MHASKTAAACVPPYMVILPLVLALLGCLPLPAENNRYTLRLPPRSAQPVVQALPPQQRQSMHYRIEIYHEKGRENIDRASLPLAVSLPLDALLLAHPIVPSSGQTPRFLLPYGTWVQQGQPTKELFFRWHRGLLVRALLRATSTGVAFQRFNLEELDRWAISIQQGAWALDPEKLARQLARGNIRGSPCLPRYRLQLAVTGSWYSDSQPYPHQAVLTLPQGRHQLYHPASRQWLTVQLGPTIASPADLVVSEESTRERCAKPAS